ncbi:hypothetical protein, partial [Nocardia sp. NPDC004750]
MNKLKVTLLASSVVLAATLLSACGSNQSSSTSTKKLKAGNNLTHYCRSQIGGSGARTKRSGAI